MKLCAGTRLPSARLAGVLTILFLAVLCFGKESTHYSFRTWQTDEGLPHNSVQSILQTADGYLWIGTVDGLARFDGVRFTVMDEKLAPELRSSWIVSFCETSDGSLWIATDGKGLFHLGTNCFRLSHAEGLPSDSVRTLYESHDGSLWIGTSNGGLIRYRDGKFFQITNKEGLSGNTVRSICEDHDGSLWVATGDGLDQIRDDKVVAIYNPTNGLPHNSIRAVMLDRDGVLWIGSNGGLTRMKDGRFTNYTTRDGLADATVSALYQDRAGQIWIGTYGGLNRLENGRLLSEMNEGETYNNVVYAIFEDREENLWVGGRAGLSRLNPRRFSTLNKQQGLTHNATVSVLEDRTGGLWIGTWGGALNCWRDGKMLSYPASEVIPITLLLALHEDHEGALWMGTDYDGGLYRFKEGVFTRWGRETGMPELALSVIYEDRQTNIWVGARTGLSRWQDGKFTHFGPESGLPPVSIKVIAQDRDNNLWIGTADGLCRYRENRFETYLAKDGLPSATILSLHEDQEHNFWIGTKGGGLVRMSADARGSASFHFTAYTTRQGLAYDDVFEILEDDFDNLWMSCGKGVFRVAKKNLDDFDRGRVHQLNSIAYGKTDGMSSIDCKGVAKPAGWKSRDGRLWFPTDKGLISVDPSLKANARPPPVVIEEILADGKPVVTGLAWSSAGASRATRQLAAVTFPPGRGELEIRYTALSFQAPEKNRFRYKLEGADRDWMDAGTRRVAYYNNLSPGNYQFRVMASNNDGIWNETGATLSLVLLPQFWQQWWFRPSIVLLVGGVVFGIYRLRLERLREIEKLRLRIAADLHDEVGSSLWSISLLSRMLQKQQLTDEQKKDASEINRIAVQTANSIRDIVWFINPEYDTLQDLLMRMKDVSSTTLGGVELEFKQPHENLSRKLPLNFRQNIFLLFKEVLANIMKHSQATQVEIKISEENRVWQMCISDNGRGFDPAQAHSGNGLKNIRRRAEKLGAELKVSSQPGQGTTVSISVPVGWK